MVNKRNLLLAVLIVCLQFWAKAQNQLDSLQQKVKKTTIDLVYNHYLQDGDHSAVTGGTGTEHLIVYGPSVSLKKTQGWNNYAFKIGADIISSASTDKIDFVLSSASVLDTRSYVNAAYERVFAKEEISLSGGLGLSVESDYLSVSSQMGIVKEDKKRLRSYSLQVQVFNDDLRWGRFDEDYRRPAMLIYPVELRGQEWQREYKRNSFNFKFGFTQVLNKRNILGIFPEFSYQQGLLATPFHRVYFSDGSLGVEQLPDERHKLGLAVRLNSFVGGRFILKNTINAYADDFGILAFAFDQETVFKLKPTLSLLANVRFYHQQAAKYFAPFQAHAAESEFHTSDFDLSELQHYTLGLGLKYQMTSALSRRWKIKAIVFRYNGSYRSDHLKAHAFTLAFQTELLPRKNKPIKP